MKFFDKVKNLFTEEVEEEVPVVKKEVRHIEIPTPAAVEEEPIILKEEPIVKKEERLLFFDDKDFEDLEVKEEIVKPQPVVKKEEPKQPLPYQGAKPVEVVDVKKNFKPSPIISPVYGVLDKNYHKEDIVTRKQRSYHSENITIDDVRDRAFATLEDDLKNEILEDDYIVSREQDLDDLDIFKDVEEDSIDDADMDIIETEVEEELIDELDASLLDDTDYLTQKLEEQKRKLDEINRMIDNNEDVKIRSKKIEEEKPKKTRSVDEFLYREQEKSSLKDEIEETYEDDYIDIKSLEGKTFEDLDDFGLLDLEEEKPKKKSKTKSKDLSDSELLDLIDSMYEKSDDNE